MKLLTINTHSLEVAGYPEKLEGFAQAVFRLRPDIIAMQEASQRASSPLIAPEFLTNLVPIPGTRPIRADNHAAQVAHRLNRAGIPCHWVWLPIKTAYRENEEGAAILSLGRPIREIDWFFISNNWDFSNWAARAALGVRVEGLEDWFYTVHMGWWDAAPEPLQDHWRNLKAGLSQRKGPIWLMGDFNAPDHLPNQGYDRIRADGWLDTHLLAQDRDSGITVPKVIDGWHERRDALRGEGTRLDYIFTNQMRPIQSSKAIFNGTNEPVVSDHFGILVTYRDGHGFQSCHMKRGCNTIGPLNSFMDKGIADALISFEIPIGFQNTSHYDLQ